RPRRPDNRTSSGCCSWVEVPPGFEPGNNGFAVRCLTSLATAPRNERPYSTRSRVERKQVLQPGQTTERIAGVGLDLRVGLGLERGLLLRELDVVRVHQVAHDAAGHHDQADDAAHHCADGELLPLHARACLGFDAGLLEASRRFDLRATLGFLQPQLTLAIM